MIVMEENAILVFYWITDLL